MATTRLEIRSDGSIKVEGDFEVVDQNGNAFGLNGRTKIALCRCGHSENKPFCDGAHRKCGFQSTIVAFELPPVATAPTTPAKP